MALDEAGIGWALLRGEAELGGRSGDVDCLVGPADVARFDEVARRLGFARLPSAGYGSHAFLVAYDQPTDLWLKLDTVTELAFGASYSLRLPDEVTATCLDRRRPAGSASVLDPADGFWTLLLHALLDKATVDVATRTRLRELATAGRTGGPVAVALSSLLPDGWSLERVVETVSADDWTTLGRLGRDVTATWRRRHPGDNLRRRAGGPIRIRLGRLARLRRPRGLEVVLVGDATTTKRLASRLGRDVPLPVRTPTLRPPGRSVARGLRDRQRLGQCLVILRAASLADLPVGWTGAAGRGSAPLEALSSPVPDLVIVLRAAGTLAQSDEHEIRVSIRSDIRIVDASVSEERLGRTVAELVWERLAARWHALDGHSSESGKESAIDGSGRVPPGSGSG